MTPPLIFSWFDHTLNTRNNLKRIRYPSTYDKPIESIYRSSSPTIKHPFGVPHYPFPATGTTNLSYLG